MRRAVTTVEEAGFVTTVYASARTWGAEGCSFGLVVVGCLDKGKEAEALVCGDEVERLPSH